MPCRTTQALAAGLATIALAGCQTYERDPLNLDEHRQAWLDRSADHESVRAFAARLAETGQSIETFDPSDGITLAEAEVIALVYNPDLRLARARANVTLATADNAGRWEDPVFQIDVLRITESVSNPWIISPGLALTIPLSGRLDAEQSRATAAHETELRRIAETEWHTRAELREAWAEWSVARQRLETTDGLLAQLESLVDSTEQLAQAGELPRSEAALFRIEQAQQRAERMRYQGEVNEGEQRIRALLGLSPVAPIHLLPALAPSEAVDEDVQTIARRNPTLARLEAAYEIAEESLRREILKQVPDLTIGPLYESDEGQSRIGFLGAIPLPMLNANRQGIAEAEAERRLARAEFETEYERIMAAAAIATARLESARSQREELERTVVPLVDRQLADARQLLELGEGGSLVMLESITRAHAVKLLLLDLRLREADAAIELIRLTGPEAHSEPSTADTNSEVTP